MVFAFLIYSIINREENCTYNYRKGMLSEEKKKFHKEAVEFEVSSYNQINFSAATDATEIFNIRCTCTLKV